MSSTLKSAVANNNSQMAPPPSKQSSTNSKSQSNENDLYKVVVNQYHCPLLHGKTAAKASLDKHCFASLFARRQLVLPLFQRRYCWTPRTVQCFLHDAISSLSAHSLEKLIFYIAPRGANDKRLKLSQTLCAIDGQQRITTAMLVLIGARDLVERRRDEFRFESAAADKFIANINTLLFLVPRDTVVADADKLVEQSRFVPTYFDRPAYFQLLLGESESQSQRDDADADSSHIIGRKSEIDKLLYSYLASKEEDKRMILLERLCDNLLDNFTFFAYIIEDAKAGAAVYQW
jgi:hypothetical protein